VIVLGAITHASWAFAEPGPTVAIFGAADGTDALRSTPTSCWIRYLQDGEAPDASEEVLEATYPGDLKLWDNAKYFEKVTPACTPGVPSLVIDVRRGFMWSVSFAGAKVNLTRLVVDDWVRRLKFRGDRLDYFVDRVSSSPTSSLVPACAASGCAHYHEAIIAEYPQLLANIALLVGGKTTELMPSLVVARRGTAAPIRLTKSGALATWCMSLSLEFATSGAPTASDWALKCAIASAVQPITLSPARFLRFFQLPGVCTNVVFDPAADQADLTASRAIAGAVVTYFAAAPDAVAAGVPAFRATGCAPSTTSYTTTIAWNASSMPLRTAPEAPPADELCLTPDQIDRLVKPIQTTTFDAGGVLKQTRISLRLTSAGGGLFSVVQRSIPDYECVFGDAWSYSGGVDNLRKMGFHSVTCRPSGASPSAEVVRAKVALLSPLELCR
jgi:hypothetical protein